MVACGCREKGGILRRVKVKGVVGLGVCLIASIAVVLLKGLYGGCAVVGDGEEVKGRGREGETRDAPLLDFPCKSQPRLCAVIMRKGVAGEIPESGPGVIPLMGGDDSGSVSVPQRGKQTVQEENGSGESKKRDKETAYVYFLQVGDRNFDGSPLRHTTLIIDSVFAPNINRLQPPKSRQGKLLINIGGTSDNSNSTNSSDSSLSIPSLPDNNGTADGNGSGIVPENWENNGDLLCIGNDDPVTAVWDSELASIRNLCGGWDSENEFLWAPKGNMSLYEGAKFDIWERTPGFTEAAKVQSSIVVEEVSLGLVDIVDIGDTLRRYFPYARKIHIFVWEIRNSLKFNEDVLEGLENLQELSIKFVNYFNGKQGSSDMDVGAKGKKTQSGRAAEYTGSEPLVVSVLPNILRHVNLNKFKSFSLRAFHWDISQWSLSGFTSLVNVNIQAYSPPLPSALPESPGSLFTSSCPRTVWLIYRDPKYIANLCNISLKSSKYTRGQGVVFPKNCSDAFSREDPRDVLVYPDDGFVGNFSTIPDISRCTNIATVPPGRYNELRWGGLTFSKELVEGFRGVDARALRLKPVAFDGSSTPVRSKGWKAEDVYVSLYLPAINPEKSQNDADGLLPELAPINAFTTSKTKTLLFDVENDPIGNRVYVSTDGLNEGFKNRLRTLDLEYVNFEKFNIYPVLQSCKLLHKVKLNGVNINIADMFNGTICGNASRISCADETKFELNDLEANVVNRNTSDDTAVRITSFRQYPHLMYLRLRNITVKFDPNLTHFGNLSSIELSNCELEHIPEMSMPDTLNVLDISSNRLTKLPSKLLKNESASNLVRLIVRNNSIVELPNSVLPIPACGPPEILYWEQLLHAGMRSSPGNGGDGIISSSPQNLNQLLCLVNDRTASAIWDADLPAFKVSCGSEGNDNFLWVPDGNMELYGGMDFTIGRSTPGFMDAVKVQSSIVVEEVSLGLVDMVEVGDVLKRNFPYAKKINIYVWEVEKKLRIRANLLDGLEHLQELSITFKSYYMGEENRNIFVNPGNTLSIGSYSSTTNYKGKSVEVSFVPDILHGVNQKKLKVFYFNAVHANLSSWSLSGCASLEDVHIQAYSLPLPSASSRSPLSLFASSCPRKVRLIYRDPTYLERLCNVSLESPMYMRNQGVVFPNCSGTFSREHPWDIQIYPDDGFLGNISTISDISRCANIASVPPGRYSKLRWGGLKFSKELVESFRGVDAETLCFSPVAFSGSFPDMERNEWSFKALHIHLYLSLKDSESKQNGIGGSLYEWAPFNALFTPETKKIMFYVDNDPVGNRFFISTDGLNETFRNSLDEIRFEHLNYKHFSILRVLQIFKRLVGISLHGMDINLAGMFNGTICAYANGTKCVLPAKYTLKSLNATITRPDDLKNTTVLHLVSLHQYPNLAHIYLNNIPVKFDDKLTNLGKISTFKFVNCGLDYIPEQSMSEDLVYFDVSSNRLKGLPSRLYKHDADSKLLTLVVRNNLIDEFSNSILPIPACSTTQDMACKGLQLLDISLNYISNIYVDLYKYFYVLFSSPTGVLNCIVLNVSHNLIDDLKVANDIPPIGKELVNNTGRNFTPMYEKLASKFNRSTSAEGALSPRFDSTMCHYNSLPHASASAIGNVEYTVDDFKMLEASGLVKCPLDNDTSNKLRMYTLVLTVTILLTFYIFYCTVVVYKCTTWSENRESQDNIIYIEPKASMLYEDSSSSFEDAKDPVYTCFPSSSSYTIYSSGYMYSLSTTSNCEAAYPVK
eukprot:Nk52_evm6s219 gene=Nk52_evmTU6s219